MDPAAMKEYNAYYGPKNPVLATLVKTARSRGSLAVLGRALTPEKEYENTEYYNNWGKKYGVYHVVHGVASGDDGSLTSLSLMRPKAADPLETDATGLMALLIPHLQRTFRIHREMEQLRVQDHAARACLNTIETAIVAVDGRCRVVFFNAPAECLFQLGNAIRMKDGRIFAVDSKSSAALEQMIRGAAATGAGRGTHPGGTMLVHSDHSEPINITVVPFSSSYMFTAERPCALILLSDPSAKLSTRRTALSTSYGLTPAEVRLCDLLLNGLELAELCEKMHITVNTGRFMLKRVFRKTGTRRQSHLLRLLLLLPADPKPQV
jgi:DNA-binding CsgD family transcriptional regulator